MLITKLAQGVPIGGEVHYLDENTLHEAFQSRKQINMTQTPNTTSREIDCL